MSLRFEHLRLSLVVGSFKICTILQVRSTGKDERHGAAVLGHHHACCLRVGRWHNTYCRVLLQDRCGRIVRLGQRQCPSFLAGIGWTGWTALRSQHDLDHQSDRPIRRRASVRALDSCPHTVNLPSRIQLLNFRTLLPRMPPIAVWCVALAACKRF